MNSSDAARQPRERERLVSPATAESRVTPVADELGGTPSSLEPRHGPRLPKGTGLLVLVAVIVSLLLLRTIGIVTLPWVLVFAPLTICGVGFVAGLIHLTFRPQLDALRTRVMGARSESAATPPPEALKVPVDATDHDDRILAQHPELLAALCHGFRMKRFAPTVLGRPVTDPWGVYEAAAGASSAELHELRSAAMLHAEHFAQSGKRKSRIGRKPSDAQVMKAGVDAFWRCAQKTIAGRSHPDCVFEHVTVVFGTSSPNRDANLKSMAPKVRALLERQYPQLRTASLVDGSHVSYAEWQRKAADDKAELARLRKEHERQARSLNEARGAIEAERARVEAMQADLDAHRAELRAAARAEQETAVGDLTAALDRARLEHGRELQRAAVEHARLAAAIAELTAERDSLERLLFAEADVEVEAIAAGELAGVRVLLVGGEPRQIGAIRDALTEQGVQLVHDDSDNAGEHVPNVHLVVFWIRYLSHPKYFAARQTVRALQAPHCYWLRTSPESLVAVITRAIRAHFGRSEG